MAHWIKFILVCLFVAKAPAGLAQTTTYMPSELATLDLRYEEQLNADAPFADAVIDERHNTWIIGRTSIWCKPDKQQKLLRITILPTTSGDRLIAMVPKKGGFFVASNSALFAVNIGSEQLKRVEHPRSANGRTYQLVRSANAVWWIHSNGVLVFPAKGKRRLLYSSPLLTNANGAWFDWKEQELWLTHKGDLSVVALKKGSTAAPSLKDHYAESVIAVSFSDQAAIAHTNHTVLRYTRAEPRLTQIIPVQKPRRLVALDTRGLYHSYLFHDRLLEVYDTKSGQKFNAQLPLNFKSAVTKMVHAPGITAVLSETRVAVFAHPEESLRAKLSVIKAENSSSPTL